MAPTYSTRRTGCRGRTTFRVRTGGTGGFGRILGPTGGYLISYLPAVAVVGIISSLGKPRVVTDVAALIAGSLIVYAVGVPWLAAVTSIHLFARK